MFKDRTDAGLQLAQKLEKFRGLDALVLGIPRGGAEVAFQVAVHLQSEFSLLISRKLPFPDSPEAGFGAVAEDGSIYMIPEARLWLTDLEIERIIKQQEKEIHRRIKVLRANRPLPDLAARTVILVDDGMAVGSTMKAAIFLCRARAAGWVVAAAPMAGAQAAHEIEAMADETVILDIPGAFQAVAQAYEYWRDLTDIEVIRIMKTWELSVKDGNAHAHA